MRPIFILLLSVIPMFAVEPPITAIVFTPDGKEIIVGSQSGTRVVSWPDLKELRTLKNDLSHVHGLAFSPDGKQLAIGGGSPGERGCVVLFSWPEGNLIRQVNPHQDLVYSFVWTADGKRLITVGADRMVAVVDVATGKSIAKLEGHSRPVLAVALLPGDKKLASAGVDGTLRVWDIATGKVERELSYHTKSVNSLAVKPTKDHLELATVASIGDDKTVRLWQPTLGRMVRFARLPSEPQAFTYSMAGAELIVACTDGSIHVVDPETVEVRSTIAGVEGKAYSLALAPDGSVVVGGGNGQLKRVVFKK